MEKEELWKIYTDKNPNFLEGPINFTAKGLKKFFDQTFDIAEKNGINKSSKHNGGSSNDYKNMFKDMFGGNGTGSSFPF